MIIPTSLEEIANVIETKKTVLFFTADWCGDCVFIKPHMPEIEESFKEFSFVQIDRDAYIDLCQQWDVFGIPSFIAIEDGKEIGRFVSKDRKTKEEIIAFLNTL
ncbi:thioredoxin family protein [Vagococcus sp. DIV0080]|uniref:Thioredoxin family protein n=1 Tax=Candidatus Vagococcus giribetii TaxID=2230876 RepID=A0ABS3HS98_9ENTE|nr:thioredoxin family protein [Vagococcus sp. DIV0080]MBO0476638.1 thioredoxin family protein [Vagococcus sp. DIV0080]